MGAGRTPRPSALIDDERILDQRTGEVFERTYFANERALGFNSREMVSGNCMALRRDLLDLLQPFPDGINYDYWIGWMADVLESRLVFDEFLQLYRRHAGNASEPVLAQRRPTPWSVLMRTGLPDPKPAWRKSLRSTGLSPPGSRNARLSSTDCSAGPRPRIARQAGARNGGVRETARRDGPPGTAAPDRGRSQLARRFLRPILRRPERGQRLPTALTTPARFCLPSLPAARTGRGRGAGSQRSAESSISRRSPIRNGSCAG